MDLHFLLVRPYEPYVMGKAFSVMAGAATSQRMEGAATSQRTAAVLPKAPGAARLSFVRHEGPHGEFLD